jgi:hypothetical protein
MTIWYLESTENLTLRTALKMVGHDGSLSLSLSLSLLFSSRPFTSISALFFAGYM